MKIGFVSLGCPKNLVDGEVMLGMARDAGYELTTDATAADVLIVNTCAFIESAKQESIDAILEMAAHKRDGRCSRLVVTGCLAERYREDLKKEIPEIDVTLGTGEIPQIVDAIVGGDFAAGSSVARSLRSSVVHSSKDAASGSSACTPVKFFKGGTELSTHRTTELPTSRTAELPTYIYNADTPRLLTTPT
jgi:ribosomal protein S12 methylthiotransferase